MILVLMLEQHGIAKQEAMDKLAAMKAEMVRYFAAHAADAGTGLEILPGVRELLHALQVRSGRVPASCSDPSEDRMMLPGMQGRTDVSWGLVTGNLEPIGWAKMKALGILDLFPEPLWCAGCTLQRCHCLSCVQQASRPHMARTPVRMVQRLHPAAPLLRCPLGQGRLWKRLLLGQHHRALEGPGRDGSAEPQALAA